jgi:hypothetical protein
VVVVLVALRVKSSSASIFPRTKSGQFTCPDV